MKKIILLVIAFVLVFAFVFNIANACSDYDQEKDYTFTNEYNNHPYSWATFYMCSGSLMNRNQTDWYYSSPSAFVVNGFSGYSYNNYTPYTITNYNVVISSGWLEYRLDRVPCNITPGNYLSVDTGVSGVWGLKGSAYSALWETFTNDGCVQILRNTIYPTW